MGSTEAELAPPVERRAAPAPVSQPQRYGVAAMAAFWALALGALTMLALGLMLFEDEARAARGSWAPFLFFTATGVTLRLFRARLPATSEVAVAPVAVAGAALVLDPGHALWAAAIIGLTGVIRRPSPRRLMVLTATFVCSTGAAVATRELLAARVLSQPELIDAGDIGVVSALGAVLGLVAVWQLVGAISDRLLPDELQGSWPTARASRWMYDGGLAAAGLVVAILWDVYAPLALVAFVPLFAGERELHARMQRWTPSVDPLTGLGNAGVLRSMIADEVARAERFGRGAGLLVVDVDGFGEINSTYGHDSGDAVLRVVAARVRSLARTYDVLCRLGGDSFALLLPEVDAAGARSVADRIRAIVSARPIEVDTAERPLSITVSVGVANYPSDADDPGEILVSAEMAASFAKLQGGNRVGLAQSLPEEFRGAARAGRSGDAVLARLAQVPDEEPVESAKGVVITESARVPAAQEASGERLVRVVAEPLAHSRPSTDRLLGFVALAALLATVAGLVFGAPIAGWGTVVLFSAVAIGAEWFAESIYGRSSSSWAAVPLIALAVAAQSPSEVVIAAAAAGIGGGVLRGTRSRQAGFNISVLILSGLAAHGVVAALAYLPLEPTSLIPSVFVGLVAGAAFFMVDTWLVATAVAVGSRSPFFDVWREDLLWLIPHQLGMGALGGAMAAAHQLIGFEGTLLLVLPAIGLHFAQRQFVGRTRDHVVRLRQLNDDLSNANTHVVRVNERLTEALQQVNEGYLVTVESLAAAVDVRDSYTGSHITRVEAYGKLLLEILDPKLTDDDQMLWGFRLHDVGKIGVPDSALLKPGPLDEEEWLMMRRHPEIGAQIIEAAPFLQGARDIVLHHHERWDGRGYPFGLAGAAIPFGARMFSSVDAFDAMTSDRPYRKAMPFEQALEEMRRHGGTQFDPEVVEAWFQVDMDRLAEVRDQVGRDLGATRRSRSRVGGLLIPIASDFEDDVESALKHERRLALR